MDKLHELIEILSDSDVQARAFQSKQSQVCKICQKSADVFESPYCQIEYQLSTICETCQKYYYDFTD